MLMSILFYKGTSVADFITSEEPMDSIVETGLLYIESIPLIITSPSLKFKTPQRSSSVITLDPDCPLCKKASDEERFTVYLSRLKYPFASSGVSYVAPIQMSKF